MAKQSGNVETLKRQLARLDDHRPVVHPTDLALAFGARDDRRAA